MCFLIFVGNYSCGHQRSPSQGIPNDFIRACEHSTGFVHCPLLTNEEDVPWLCPNCHWEYVEQNLTPLWQQTTITKCRVLQDAEMFPAEPSYWRAQGAADRLQQTFEAQQEAINQSAVAYHELRDEILRAFLCENFRFWMNRTHQSHRPWSMSILRDPFARGRFDPDVNADSSGSAETLIDLGNSDRVVGEPPQEPMEVANRPNVELDPFFAALSNASSSDHEVSEDENERRTCFWCSNVGIATGVIPGQTACSDCRRSGYGEAMEYYSPRAWRGRQLRSEPASESGQPPRQRRRLNPPEDEDEDEDVDGDEVEVQEAEDEEASHTQSRRRQVHRRRRKGRRRRRKGHQRGRRGLRRSRRGH